MTWRPSRYAVVGRTVLRHPGGRLVRPVLLATSARVFLVDLATADRLRGVGSLGEDDERRLAEVGLLVPLDADEARTVIDSGRRAAQDGRDRVFVVMPSAYCNLGCAYCGQVHERGVLTQGHRVALADRVARAAASGRYDHIQIRWFGGEPLMAYAVVRDLSRRFVEAIEGAAVRYSAGMVTNGALLDLRKLVVLHQECRVGRIEVTLDGPAHHHDVSRPLKGGGGSFDRIVSVLRSAVDSEELAGLSFTVRTNVGRHNADLADEFAAALAAAGLAHPRVRCYVAPLHPWGNDVSGLALGAEAMADIEMSWLEAYLRHGLHTTVLPGGPRPVVCAAVTRHSEVVAPDGRVYSCTEQPLVPGFTDRALAPLDDLPAADLRPAGDFDDWYDALQRNETGCRDCAIMPMCGGACPKLWREGSPPCPPLKRNVHQRLDLYARGQGCTPVDHTATG